MAAAGAAPCSLAVPRGTTVIGFDYGERYTGVAIGDTGAGMAHPLGTIEARTSETRLAAIARLVAEWQPDRLVVGLPLSLEGEAHGLTRRARAFAHELQRRFRLTVDLVDERLSSADAASRLRALGRGGRKHKGLVHPVAAQLILQGYLDERNRTA